MLDQIAREFAHSAPSADYWTLRLVEDSAHVLTVRRGVVEPPYTYHDAGAMVTVLDGGGIGYGATCDLTPRGLTRAFEVARRWARAAGAYALIAPKDYPRLTGQGNDHRPGRIPWDRWSLSEKLDLLRMASRGLEAGDAIVDWYAQIAHTSRESLLVSGDGAWMEQSTATLHPVLGAVANRGERSQSRTLGHSSYRQGGLEELERIGYVSQSPRVAAEALQLLDAPTCPSGTTSLVLMPSQMVLQVHESIGHPLELDRILGDERNYAGTSFVTLDMFGRYRYGSSLLNVTFAPDIPGEAASYAFDDDGTPAERAYLIRRGILERPLGGAISQARSGLPGVANSRATSWNRPPIDRMSNVNLEPGTHSMADLVGGVERGVLMDTNRSWSIDDSRNKFQFGCEVGWLIEDGEVKGMVRDPRYRGVSAVFWRSLDGVGNRDTFEVMGTPSCGKGEPNQGISAGHAAPTCRFRDVEVFGEE